MSLKTPHKLVYEALRDLQTELGYAPSLEEIAERVGLNTKSTVREHMRTLARHGLITYDEKIARSWRIIAPWPVYKIDGAA